MDLINLILIKFFIPVFNSYRYRKQKNKKQTHCSLYSLKQIHCHQWSLTQVEQNVWVVVNHLVHVLNFLQIKKTKKINKPIVLPRIYLKVPILLSIEQWNYQLLDWGAAQGSEEERRMRMRMRWSDQQ